MTAIDVRIAARRIEADGIVSVEMAALDGQPLPPFSAGSHIDVHLPGGLVRQYSLCNDSSQNRHYLTAVLQEPASRGGSRAMHALAVGDLLQISAPKNHFALVPSPRTLLLAGGIGVTPLLCMAERLSATGAAFEMHYCTRSRSRTAFLGRITDSAFASRVRFHFDDGAAPQVFDARRVLAEPAADLHAYLCGPTGFIDHVLAVARAAGWADDRLHIEYFGAAPVDTRDDGSFQVQLASSGAVHTIPADKSVVEVLAAAGIAIAVSCEQGVCGTCTTRVLEGECDHRDLFLTDDEHRTQFTPCCSRAKSRLLVLDL